MIIKIRNNLLIYLYIGWLSKNMKVLDIGTGTGILAEGLRKYFGFDLLTTYIKDQRVADVPFFLSTKHKLLFEDKVFTVCRPVRVATTFHDLARGSTQRWDRPNALAEPIE